jgi:hypothetical protein
VRSKVSGWIYVMEKLNTTDSCIIILRKAITKYPAGKGELEFVA